MFDLKSLKANMAVHAKIKHPSNVIGDCLTIQESSFGVGIELVSTNLSSQLATEVQLASGVGVHNETGLPFSVSKVAFHNFVKTAKHDVNAEVVDNTLVLTSGGAKAVLRPVKLEAMNIYGDNNLPYVQDASKIISSIVRASTSATSESYKTAISCVSIKDDGNKLEIAGTDSYRLYKADSKSAFGQPVHVLIAKSYVPIIKMLPKLSKNISFGVSIRDKEAFFIGDTFRFYLNTDDAQYPAYDRIISNDTVIIARVNRKDILASVSQFKGALSIDLDISGDSIDMSSSVGGVDISDSVFIHNTSFTTKTRMDQKFLSQALTEMDTEEVIISIDSSEIGNADYMPKPLYLTSADSNEMHMIMPQRR